jgi:hypothetical protein
VTDALEQIRPEHPRTIASVFQFVSELPSSFADAAVAGARTVLPSRSSEVTDWAFLLDLRLGGERNFVGQLEYGIVRDLELPLRLSRHVGRMRESPMLQDVDWSDVKFPSVALFADIRLETEAVGVAGELSTTARSVLTEGQNASNALIEDLISGLDIKEDDAVGAREPE